MESRGVPQVMEQSSTYESVEPYIFDLLSYHDHRFLNQPNAVFPEEDGRKQMAEMVMLRAVGYHFISRGLRIGPFTLCLTDLHDGNIFVDKLWNITYVIDLEWACLLPIDMLDAPYWLTGLGVDEIQGDEYRAYDAVREEYMRILKEEEAWQGSPYSFNLTEHIDTGWRNGRYWYYLCLRSVNAMYTIVPHLCAKHSLSGLSGDAAGILARLWDHHSAMTLEQKLKDKQKYDAELREAFNEPGQQEHSDISKDRDQGALNNEAESQSDQSKSNSITLSLECCGIRPRSRPFSHSLEIQSVTVSRLLRASLPDDIVALKLAVVPPVPKFAVWAALSLALLVC